MHFFNFVKRNKKMFFLIIILVISIALVGGGYFFMMSNDKINGINKEATTVKNKYVAYELGDVNMDGVIDKSDADLLLEISAKLKTATADQKVIGDMNGDGTLTAQDSREILRSIGK